MSGGSWGRDVFDRIYARADDPWDFTASAYEQDKYSATLAALPRARFADCLEVGCSIGVQTRLLAARCDRVLGIDLAPEALRRAAARCADLPHVSFAQAQVPRCWPPGSYDLIVLSEVLYFLDSADIAGTARLVLGGLRPGGAVVLVNWTGRTDTPTTGDRAAELLMQGVRPWLTVTSARRAPGYRLDVLGETPA